jgi:hypothetical protein
MYSSVFISWPINIPTGRPHSGGEILERQNSPAVGSAMTAATTAATGGGDGGNYGNNHGRRMAGRPELTWPLWMLIL